jgi:hypothetical protein
MTVLGTMCGFLWKSPVKDSAYSAIVFGLACLLIYIETILTIYQTNPPYCWGDVWTQKEKFLTETPHISDVLVLRFATGTPIFVVSGVIMILIRKSVGRFKRHRN